MNSSPKSLAELLTLRSTWEDIVIRYKIPEKQGTLDNLQWFVQHGQTNNRFRKRCKEAIALAQTILEEYENGRGKETTTGFEVGSSRP